MSSRPRLRPRWLRLGAALAAGLLVSGCASIPESSEPEAVKSIEPGNTTAPAAPPPTGIDPFGLVRNYVDAAAEPTSNHGAARLRMTPAASRGWRVPPQLSVVDNVDTIPTPAPPGTPDSVRFVSLQANRVGQLRPDQSFVPESGTYRAVLRVERQPDGQWRIATPPPDLVTSRVSFAASYKQIPIYFLNHARTAVAPDLRYVVAQPSSTLPQRAIEMLMRGPSQGMEHAVDSAIPPGASLKTNASETSDGALQVNLSELGDPPVQVRRQIAAQVVLSLQRVSTARVRLLEEGAPLLPNQPELRPTDVGGFQPDSAGPRPELPGLVVVDERLHVLDRRTQPVPGPAGNGQYAVVQAAQSEDGQHLAAAVRNPQGGVGLRVGDYGSSLADLGVNGTGMSRPSWRGPGEVWTVVGGNSVVRAVDHGGAWEASPVDAGQFAGGQAISDLRVSRDGTKVAGVVNGQIVVAGITEDAGRVVLGPPTPLAGTPHNALVTGVDWLTDDSLVATTDSKSAPVLDVSVDGSKWTPYSSENLAEPLTAVTVGPGRRVVVSDRSGLWEASNPHDVWRLLQVPIGSGSIPFFPG
jgi:hypothetical protein